jgi:hypothetical protein
MGLSPRVAVRVSPRVRNWLTGRESDPSVRARFWSEVEGCPPADPKVRASRRSIGRIGWAAALLKHQFPDGHWLTPGTSGPELYRPKYVATFWHALVLSDLGLTREDSRVRKTAELIFERFDQRGSGEDQLDYRPRGRHLEICVTALATRALIRFGYLDHPAVQRSVVWITRAQMPDGGWNDAPATRGTLDAWEPLATFAEIPPDRRAPNVRQAIDRGSEFYLQRRLMNEGRRSYAPWFRLHYPNHYYYDLLVGLGTLTRLGYGRDPRVRPAVRWLRRKQLPDGTWSLDAAHPDLDPTGTGYRFEEPSFPMMLEPPRRPSRWATVEALSVLSRVEAAE